MTQAQPASPTPQQQVLGIAVINWGMAHAIRVAAFYGIADLLQEGNRSIAELASATHTHLDSLYRLLRALAAIGVFEETNPEAPNHQERRFAQTPVSECLCQHVPGSLYAMVRQFGSEWEHKSWAELAYSVRTGQPAFDYVFGKNVWEHFTQDRPDEGAIFHQSLSALSHMIHAAIVEDYDFSGIERLMDVGGGEGLPFNSRFFHAAASVADEGALRFVVALWRAGGAQGQGSGTKRPSSNPSPRMR